MHHGGGLARAAREIALALLARRGKHFAWRQLDWTECFPFACLHEVNVANQA